MPENVTASEVNSTSVTLKWDAPSNEGTFGINFYIIRLVPSLYNEVIKTIMTEVFVSGLLPGTEYTVIVAATINMTSLLPQEEIEVESQPVMFTTSVSGLS